jgi:PAS domain S-box-containing protein
MAINIDDILSSTLLPSEGHPAPDDGTGVKNAADTMHAEVMKCKSDARHRTIVPTAMDGFWLVDTQRRLVEVNAAYCRMSGYSEQELLTMKVSDLDIDETAADATAHMHKIRWVDGACFHTRHRRKDGSIIDVEACVQCQELDGEFFLTFMRDITARKRSETVLRMLSQAVEQSPVAIMITDNYGTIEFVNPRFTEITGYSEEEAVGQNPRILKSGMTPPETYKSLWSTITAGKAWEGEFINKRRNGGLFWENAKISALRDDTGIITHYLAFKEDITEKKSIMEQLLQSQKMESIGHLAGGLAHDLNNILSVVNGFASVIQLDLDQNHEHFNYLNEITAASSRAASLTRSLMAYSRKQEMNQQILNLNTLVTTVGAFISRIIHENIIFHMTLQDAPLVNVDAVQIEQVLLNLTTNARDAMPNGGTFIINTAAVRLDEQFIAAHGFGTVGRYAVITVTDSGHGMDAEARCKVFDPFFTTKAVDKGTGLGLSMVMGIITQHGGFIDLQSEPGVGSTFQLYLPMVDTEEIAAEPAAQKNQLESASGTILVAEDDEATRSAVAEFLTRAGYTVISAIDGQDAVEKFAAHSGTIDLVISDVVMPRKSGKAACDEIRQMSERVKFIFVSGHADSVIEREGILRADTQIIIKPILPFELFKRIKELLK